MESATTLDIEITVNGMRRTASVESNRVLADLLRDIFKLKGCKVACDAGVCGSCTVLIDGIPVAACSIFAFAAHQRAVTTIEGMSGEHGLHPLQQAFLDGDAFQCGFCTPGMIVSMSALLAAHPAADEQQIRDWLSGHLCRCTGYQMIVDAIKAAAAMGTEAARAKATS